MKNKKIIIFMFYAGILGACNLFTPVSTPSENVQSSQKPETVVESDNNSGQQQVTQPEQVEASNIPGQTSDNGIISSPVATADPFANPKPTPVINFPSPGSGTSSAGSGTSTSSSSGGTAPAPNPTPTVIISGKLQNI